MVSSKPQISIAAITDEFSPSLVEALAAMREVGMSGAELRTVEGTNIMDLPDDNLGVIKAQLEESGMAVVSIASPLLKCVLPDGPELDRRFQQDAFASRHTFTDQARLAERAFQLARFFGAPLIRVFSYWRTVHPQRCFDSIATALTNLADAAGKHNITIGLENEHACNVGTATEVAQMLHAVQHPNLKLVWDPANALVAGEEPFPFGYYVLPRRRIAHVHAKDCRLDDDTPVWLPLGMGLVQWGDQVAALRDDEYSGSISLETHWTGPDGNKLEGSVICGSRLRELVS